MNKKSFAKLEIPIQSIPDNDIITLKSIQTEESPYNGPQYEENVSILRHDLAVKRRTLVSEQYLDQVAKDSGEISEQPLTSNTLNRRELAVKRRKLIAKTHQLEVKRLI